MKKASITDAKNRLSALIDELKAGAPVLIMDRGRPVARLEAIAGEDVLGGRLSRLVRAGLVRPGRASLSKALFATLPARSARSPSAVAALVNERRHGR